MNMTERAVGSVTIIDLDGKLNLGDATTRLHDKINSLLLQGCKHVVLNLSAVTAVDSGGLGELVRTLTTMHAHGGAVKVLNLPKRIHDLLVMTRLVTAFEVFDSEAEAVKSFG